MSAVTAERQLHGAIFQRVMEEREIKREILRLEKKFRKIDKYGNISEWFDLQDELGVMYNRLMRIQRIKMAR